MARRDAGREVRISSVRWGESGESATLSALVSGLPGTPPEGFTAYFKVPRRFGPGSGGRTDATPFLVAALPSAVHRRMPVKVDEPVSGTVLEGAAHAMRMWERWSRGRHSPVEIAASPAPDPEPAADGACFFSGGLDSFYSVLSHTRGRATPPLDHLLLVHGFDLPLEDRERRRLVSEDLQRAAAGLGLPLVEVETNLRELTNPHADWAGAQFGQSLAAIGLSLSHRFGRVVIPASNAAEDHRPWGGHPMVDPLWSSGATEIVHHGTNAGRVEKVRRELIRSDVALAHLRVCFRNAGSRFNCGECEKCLRTMINFEAAGALERAGTLPSTIDPGAVARAGAFWWPARNYACENLWALERQGRREDLQRALRRALRPRPAVRLRLRLLGKRLRLRRDPRWRSAF